MDLYAAIEEALGSNRIVDLVPSASSTRSSTPSMPLQAFRRRLVLWPLVNRASALTEFLAALGAGVVPVMVPGDTSQERLDHLSSELPGYGKLIGGTLVPPAQPAYADEEIVFALLTSGSTGKPKVIATSAVRAAAGVQAIHAAQALEPCACTAMSLPAAYSYAFVNQLLWSVLLRRSLVVSRGLTPPVDTFRRLDASGADMLCLVASQVRSLAALGIDGLIPLPRVTRVNFAGAPFPAERMREIRCLFPNARVFNNYGCAEAMPRLCIREVSEPVDPFHVGPPIGDLRLRIGGDRDTGPVQFRGSSTALGVLESDGRLRRFDAWIDSGDTGRIENDGSLRVLGRHDQVVKVAGERLNLSEIETTLLACGFDHAFVWKSADEEAIVAVVSTPRSAPSEIRSRLRSLLSRIALPRHIYVAPRWKQLPNGKTDREALRDAARSGELETLW